MRQDADTPTASAEELLRLATDKTPGWLATATWFWGGTLVMQGRLEDGIAELQLGLEHRHSGHERCYQTGCLCSLARAQVRSSHPEEGLNTVSEALAEVEKSDERYCEAEIYRLQGELHLSQGEEPEAEASLRRAIEVARRQEAKSWQLRATTSLARLWRDQGKREEARAALIEVYDWFTEGFDTPDLVEARTLLEALS